MKVGVLNVQGDVTEHLTALRRAADSAGLKADITAVKDEESLRTVEALVIPGGESTTMGMLIRKYALEGPIKRLAGDGVPIMGTCAGLILLASEGGGDVLKTGQPLLSLMDVRIARNAFGRQRDSFEAELDIPVLGKRKFHGVFIRAPVIERVWGGVKVLGEYDRRIVMARQDNMLAVAFHPELADDLRVHRFFLEMV